VRVGVGGDDVEARLIAPTIWEMSLKPRTSALARTRSRTVLPLVRPMRSASVPRSGFASTAITRSSRVGERHAEQRRDGGLADAALAESTGTNFAPPERGAAMRRSSALRARARLLSPRLMRRPESV
jgi:hypothetical protein